jgi:hypothetical protein
VSIRNTLLSATEHHEVFPCYYSVVSCYSRAAPPQRRDLLLKWSPQQSHWPLANAITLYMGSISRHPSNQSLPPKCLNCQIPASPAGSNNPESELVDTFSHGPKAVSTSTDPVTMCKTPFSHSSYAFRTIKWFNLVRRGRLGPRASLSPYVPACPPARPPACLGGWLVGSFVGLDAIATLTDAN